MQLGLTFVDMDALLEQRHGKTVFQIFKSKGEAFFRQQERDLVRELTAVQGRVIATGGGVVLNPNNLRDLSRTGVVVCCWVDAGVAYERTKGMKDRPLLEGGENGLARVESLLSQRESLYKAVPLQIDTSAMSVEQQADALVRLYKQHAGV